MSVLDQVLVLEVDWLEVGLVDPQVRPHPQAGVRPQKRGVTPLLQTSHRITFFELHRSKSKCSRVEYTFFYRPTTKTDYNLGLYGTLHLGYNNFKKDLGFQAITPPPLSPCLPKVRKTKIT